MKKYLAAFAALAAVLVLGVPAALGTDSGFYTYAGGTADGTTAIGSATSVVLKMKSLILNNSGHAAGWMGVTGADGSQCQINPPPAPPTWLPKPWIQAGISWSAGGTPHFYVEYHLQSRDCPKYISLGPAPAFNTNYSISIVHVGNGQWRPIVAGYTLSPTLDPGVISANGTVTVGGSMTATQYMTESWNVPATSETNAMDFVFGSISPWTTSQLQPWTRTNLNDSILNITTHSFEATQIAYGGSCQPQCQAPAP